MPILLKKIDGNIISYFSANNADYLGDTNLINSVVGEAGIEDYILLTVFEGLVQDFSAVIEAEFCDPNPISYGSNQRCKTDIFGNSSTLNISF